MKLPHEWSDEDVSDVSEQLLGHLRAAGRTVETPEGAFVVAGTVAQQIDLLAEVVAGLRRALAADNPEAGALLAWSLVGGAQLLYQTCADEAAARAN